MKSKIEPRVIQVFNLLPDADYKNTHRGRVYDTNGISPTVFNYAGGGNRHAKIILYGAGKKKVNENKSKDMKEKEEKSKFVLPKELEGKQFRIRKLTPRECFRLMDVDDEDIDKIQGSKISNSSQYKIAGNSICVNVMYHIFRKLLVDKGPDMVKNKERQLSLF